MGSRKQTRNTDMNIAKLASYDRQDRKDGRDARFALEMIALKAERAARRVIAGAQELATLAGIAELVLVVEIMRAQAWIRISMTRIELAFVQ
jgi:hypothetical protein